MKKFVFLLLIAFSSYGFSQSDTSSLNKQEKNNRFQVSTRVIRNNILAIPDDFKEVGLAFSQNWKRTALYTTGFIGLIITDNYTTSFLQHFIEPVFDFPLPDIAIANNRIPWLHGKDAYISYTLTGLYFGSVVINNEKGQIVAGNAVKAMTYSYIISHLLLKSVFARNRPQRFLTDSGSASEPFTKSPYDFFNFHPVYSRIKLDGTSFPSFHATTYFAVAKVLQMEYDNYWLPYSFVTAIFMANFKLHQHWFSDIIAGGVIGTILGKSIVLSSRKQKGITSALLIPQVSFGNYGVTFQATF